MNEDETPVIKTQRKTDSVTWYVQVPRSVARGIETIKWARAQANRTRSRRRRCTYWMIDWFVYGGFDSSTTQLLGITRKKAPSKGGR